MAVLPIAMVSAYASNLFVPTPPRLAANGFLPVAEITVGGSTVGLADSSLYFLTDPTLTIDPAQVAKHLDEMQALGIDNIRVYVPWRYVETAQGQYDWSSMDVIMSLAAERNMGVLAAINTSPTWVDPSDQRFPGAAHPDGADFEHFVSAFATKYGSTVSAYEIWNEPNYIQFYDPVDPAAYANLLKAVYPALKEIDPTATIVAAGLGHGPTTGVAAMSPVEFVQGMYAAGAKGYFDALAYHPYQETTPFSQGTADGYALDQALAMVALMASNGDYVTGPDGQPLLDTNGNPVTKKIWATEYGLPTSRVSYEHQADYIQDFLTAWSMQSWAGPAYVYTTVDSSPGSNDPEGNYGVYTVDANGTWVKKPAADVLAAWILAHPNQTFDPTDPTGPTDPLQAFALALQQFVQQFVQAISLSFVGAIVQAVTNWLGSFAGPAVTNAAPSTLRVASAEPFATAGPADLPKTELGDTWTVAQADHPAEKTEATEAEAMNTVGVDLAARVPDTAVRTSGATEPVVTETVVTGPVVTGPVVTGPVVTEPVVKERVLTERDATEQKAPPAGEPATPAGSSITASTPSAREGSAGDSPSADSKTPSAKQRTDAGHRWRSTRDGSESTTGGTVGPAQSSSAAAAPVKSTPTSNNTADDRPAASAGTADAGAAKSTGSGSDG